MGFSRKELIKKSRELYQNPYAHLDGEGGFDAIVPESSLDIHERRLHLQNPYAYLDEHGGYEGSSDGINQNGSQPIRIDVEQLLLGSPRARKFTKDQIEKIANKLQLEIWNQKSEIFVGRDEITPLDILDPVVALGSIGYGVNDQEPLGHHSIGGENFEVAGIVDRANREVRISSRFSGQIKRFTAAHELGHAILHPEAIMHRDRAIDGSSTVQNRDRIENEADAFAAAFLMPVKQVRREFVQRFLCEPFSLDDNTAFALGHGSLSATRTEIRTLRDLTRMLAQCEHYNQAHFNSMAKLFGVSTEAMAIRLEELRLVEF